MRPGIPCVVSAPLTDARLLRRGVRAHDDHGYPTRRHRRRSRIRIPGYSVGSAPACRGRCLARHRRPQEDRSPLHRGLTDLCRRRHGDRGPPRHRARRLDRDADPAAQHGEPAVLALSARDGVPVHDPPLPRDRDLRRATAARRSYARLPSGCRRVVLGMARRVGRADRELHHERRSRRRRCQRRRPLPAVVRSVGALADARRDMRRCHCARPAGARHDDRPGTPERVGLHGGLGAPSAHAAGAPRRARADVGRPPVRPHRIRWQLRHLAPHRLDRRATADLHLRAARDRAARRGSRRSSPAAGRIPRRARSWPER